MHIFKICSFILFVALFNSSLVQNSSAQERNKATLSGTIKDSITGETLIGATISIKELAGIGAASNAYGFYSLTVPKGKYSLRIGYVGYATKTIIIEISKDITTTFFLSESSTQLQEVVIKSGKDKSENPRMGYEKLQIKEINKLPVLMGERDVLKTIQLLPGIKSAGEGNSGFNVRGGNSDQNLILLDEAPVYNASHLLGFFSTFNSDALKDVTVYKGDMPAQYGGRLSSVLDIKMNDGNINNFHLGGGIGLISSRLYAEGPLVKEKSSFLINARRTYADAFLKLSKDPGIKDNTLYFYDFNAKINYNVSQKDKLFLSGYFGHDNFNLKNTFGVEWGNATGTLRWNHLFSQRLFSNTSFIFSNYNYQVNIVNGSNEFAVKSIIRDLDLKQEYNFYPSPNHTVRFGFDIIHHSITPRSIEAIGNNPTINNKTYPNQYSLEDALFISHKWDIANKVSLEYGFRLTSFAVLGGSDYYNIVNNKVTDTLHYSSGEVIKHYLNPEPRLSFAYKVTSSFSIKASYSRNVQNLHLLTNSTSSTPTDRWVSSSNYIKPELADQFSIGVFKSTANKDFEFSTELYYKDLKNQIDFKDGADMIFTEPVETQLLFGRGRAYGAELLIKKNTGKLTGWIGYTLSRTEKQINGINNNMWYLARQDKTHDISIVCIYEISPKWILSSTWVYSTGSAVTFPTGKYIVDNTVVFLYSNRNGYRMPAYHRLDLGATYKFDKRKHYESDLSFGIYNAYGRKNPYAIRFEQGMFENSDITQANQIILFRFVPYLTYNFKF